MIRPDMLPRDALTRVDAPRLKLMHLMALALYERDAPMTYEDIRDRLLGVGVDRPVRLLQKAWGGRSLMRKSRDGTFHLDVEDPDWRWVELVVSNHLGLQRAVAPTATPRLELVPPPATASLDTVPLAPPEVDLALRDGLRGAFSLRRCLIALADSAREPLTVENARFILMDTTPGRVTRIDIERSLRGPAGALSWDSERRIVVDTNHPDVALVRREVRERAAGAAERLRAEDDRLRNAAAYKAREAQERAERRAWYAGAEKLVLRVLFAGEDLAAAAVLDPDARRVDHFDDPAALRSRLERAEIVLGLDPWPDLAQLGVPANSRKLVDLSPPQKTRSLNASGRVLRVTPTLLIGGTLQSSKPLGDDDTFRVLLAGGERGKARRRLEADLKVLWRFYEYGTLHRFVRLRWGFLDELVFVNWNVGALPTVGEILREALEDGGEVDMVLGTPPGWNDPWSRARPYRVLAVEWDHALFEGREGPVPVGFDEIANVRPRRTD